jgi:hypothetical protein
MAFMHVHRDEDGNEELLTGSAYSILEQIAEREREAAKRQQQQQNQSSGGSGDRLDGGRLHSL